MRVWVKRDSGQYWPTICQIYQGNGLQLFLHIFSISVRYVYYYVKREVYNSVADVFANCAPLVASASALEYDSNSQRLFVGLSTGLLHVSTRPKPHPHTQVYSD